jgi:hypothetical protein
MVVVHNPIQNKWLNNLIYLSEQIYVVIILLFDGINIIMSIVSSVVDCAWPKSLKKYIYIYIYIYIYKREITPQKKPRWPPRKRPFGVIWKSDMNMPFVVISTNRKVISKIFTGLKI